MDLFESSSFPAALRGTFSFSFIQDGPSAAPTVLDASALQDIKTSSKDLGVAEMKRQQWESLKPLIQRVYIEEDKPFLYVTNILRDEHGFEPTKRQFLRKMDEWGFRKNVSRFERRKILQTHSELVPDLNDRRLKPGKLKNWRRRYRHELTGTSIIGGLQSSVQAANYRSEQHLSSLGLQTSQNSKSEEKSIPFPAHDTAVDASEASEPATGDSSFTDICQDPWPFDWSTVDVLGSPGLSTLFKGLKIECDTPIPPLSLDTSEYDEPACLSSWEIQSLSNGCTELVDGDSNQGSPLKAFVSVETSFSTSHPHYPWRDISTVYCGYSPSPLNEVYIFPPPQNASRKALNPKVTAWEFLETEQKELEIQLAKLKGIFQVENPAVIAVMEDLAGTYYEMEKFKRAELIYRQLVDVYLRTAGPQNVKTLESCVNVVDSVLEQGQYIKAQSLSQNLRAEVLKLVPSDHSLAISVTDTAAHMAVILEKDELAESLRRQVLQLRLASFGPRHIETVRTMKRLGHIISERSKPESEILLRTAVQLSLQDTAGNDEDRCELMASLGSLLQCNGSYQEGDDLMIETLKRFRPSLGSEHREIIRLERQLAWSMFNLGKLTESEKLFRAHDFRYSSDEMKTNKSYLAYAWIGLAYTLSEMGRTEEATGWAEKAFAARLSCHGANNSLVISSCYLLGEMYEQQGRQYDALALYHQVIDKIRDTGSDPDGAIAHLESEILRLEEQMEESTINSSISDEESSEDQSDSDDEAADQGTDGDGAERQEVVEEVGKVGEKSRLEMEDWMAFINEDFPTP